MKFGIFYELQLPRPWEAGGEQQLFKNALDQVELADRLGVDYAWMVEHHFLEEYSHCPAPEVFLGAASQRTKNIRLGHGIIQLTTNHPARVVERVHRVAGGGKHALMVCPGGIAHPNGSPWRTGIDEFARDPQGARTAGCGYRANTVFPDDPMIAQIERAYLLIEQGGAR